MLPSFAKAAFCPSGMTEYNPRPTGAITPTTPETLQVPANGSAPKQELPKLTVAMNEPGLSEVPVVQPYVVLTVSKLKLVMETDAAAGIAAIEPSKTRTADNRARQPS